MSEFTDFSKAVHAQYARMAKHPLFETGADNSALTDHYLAAFPPGTDPIYRTNTEHDCTCCKNFIKNLGNLVAVIDGQVHTVWDVAVTLPYPYDVVAATLAQRVRSQPITGIFRTSERQYGAAHTMQSLTDGSAKRWNHLHGEVTSPHLTSDAAQQRGTAATNVQTLKRGLEQLAPYQVQVVLDLIQDKSLYRGEEHGRAVKAFQLMQTQYLAMGDEERTHFLWLNNDDPAAYFRNSVIGTLIQDLTDSDDVEASVKSFEAKVAPANYKRPTALVTPAMVKDAMKTIQTLGIEDSLARRMATISDVAVNNVLWVNNETQSKMKGGIESLLMQSVKPNVKDPTDKAVDISIQDFMDKILPTVTDMQLWLKNTHIANLMTLTAPQHPDSPQLFKWPNGFAWSYSGNTADSDMRAAVQARGGRVDGVFRFTHSWNHVKRNASLMDLHVFLPTWSGRVTSNTIHDEYGTKERVGWNCRSHRSTGGVQDVDYTTAAPVGYVPVENITFPDLSRMPQGEYVCKIHNWALREPTQGGFKAEIEFQGQVFEYDWPTPLRNKEWVEVARVTLKDGKFSIKHTIPTSATSQSVWGMNTQQMVKVNTVLNSPNHWDGHATGNKHWFFILEGCNNPMPARGIYNEFLTPELDKHRKVFELLGDKTKCPSTTDQLSGVGFSSTSGAEVTVQVTGAKLRKTFNIKF